MAENDCEKPEEHCDMHACQLQPTAMNPQVAKMFEDPRYVCGNCGRKTHNEENLCRPKAI
jgi:hypothetical protein